MKVKDTITIDHSPEKDQLHVKILGKVDGYIPADHGRKLDDVLNSSLEYDEKIAAIKEMCDAS